jgi:ABC-type transport system substrate-binding protein
MMKRNPGFGQFEGDLPYVDAIEWSMTPDYNDQLSQFRAGGVYVGGSLSPADVLALKLSKPSVALYQAGLVSAGQRLYFGQLPGSPFRDERVRQAQVLTWDRQNYESTVLGLWRFQEAGIPVEAVGEAALPASAWSGWYLDPSGRDFGPNARFFRRDLWEASKLLAAAGYPNGLDSTVTTPIPDSITPASLYNGLDTLIAMSTETGLFRLRRTQVRFTSDWVPNWQNAARGRFTGMGVGPASAQQDPALYLHSHYNWTGAFVQGNDATLDDLTSKSLREFDDTKRRELVHEIQRYEGGKHFFPKIGAGSTFSLVWPCVRNWNVFQGGTGHGNPSTGGAALARVFVDQDRPPLGRF